MKSPNGLVSVEMKFLGSWDYVSSLECSKMIPNHYMKHVSPFLSRKKKMVSCFLLWPCKAAKRWLELVSNTMTTSGYKCTHLRFCALIFLIAFFESIFYRYLFQIFILGRISQNYGPFKSAGHDLLDDLWILEPSNLGWPFISMYEHWVHQCIPFIRFFFVKTYSYLIWSTISFFHLFHPSLYNEFYMYLLSVLVPIPTSYPFIPNHQERLFVQLEPTFSNASPLRILPMSLLPQRFFGLIVSRMDIKKQHPASTLEDSCLHLSYDFLLVT